MTRKLFRGKTLQEHLSVLFIRLYVRGCEINFQHLGESCDTLYTGLGRCSDWLVLLLQYIQHSNVKPNVKKQVSSSLNLNSMLVPIIV